MVRDLEQIKENDEHQALTKKEKVPNNGTHHCKFEMKKYRLITVYRSGTFDL